MRLRGGAGRCARRRRSAGGVPDKPGRFILGFSPGGGVDIQARIVGDVLQKRWGQTIVIESRAGANGSIAAEFVARAAPDGYTVLWVSNAHTATPSLLKLNYDAIKSFAPITRGGPLGGGIGYSQRTSRTARRVQSRREHRAMRVRSRASAVRESAARRDSGSITPFGGSAW